MITIKPPTRRKIARSTQEKFNRAIREFIVSKGAVATPDNGYDYALQTNRGILHISLDECFGGTTMSIHCRFDDKLNLPFGTSSNGKWNHYANNQSWPDVLETFQWCVESICD